MGSDRPKHVRALMDPSQGDPMILVVCVSLNEIPEKKKGFPWPRPGSCPKCRGPRLWFLGFARAFFDESEEGVVLRRLRCPDCKAVHRMRPAGYFRRFRAPVGSIRFSIRHRLETGPMASRLVTSKAGTLAQRPREERPGYSGPDVAPAPPRRKLRPTDRKEGDSSEPFMQSEAPVR